MVPRVLLVICVALTMVEAAELYGGRFNSIGGATFGRESPINIEDSSLDMEELECGFSKPVNKTVSAKIINGTNALPGQYPHQVRLIRESLKDGTMETVCGGVLIDNDLILTDAHCVTKNNDCEYGQPKYNDASLFKVILGDHSQMKHDDGEVEVQVMEVIPHENYDCLRDDNDIALLRIEQPISYVITKTGHGSINRICLPQEDSKYKTGERLIVTGWGDMCVKQYYEQECPITTNILQVANLELKDDLECQRPDLIPFNSEKQICVDDGVEASCHLDSGGPVIRLMEDGRFELVGLVSRGPADCNPRSPQPEIPTRVSYYLNWIAEKKQLLSWM